MDFAQIPKSGLVRDESAVFCSEKSPAGGVLISINVVSK